MIQLLTKIRIYYGCRSFEDIAAMMDIEEGLKMDKNRFVSFGSCQSELIDEYKVNYPTVLIQLAQKYLFDFKVILDQILFNHDIFCQIR